MAMPKFEYRPEIEILGRVDDRFAQILSYPALAFIADLHQHFDARRG